MSRCLVKLPHKKCGSSDALQVFENEDGSISGFCFSCGTPVKDPLGEGKTAKDIPESKITGKSDEEVKEELDFIGSLGCCDLPGRRIRGSSLEYYQVRVGLSEEDGKTPNIVFFPRFKDGVVVSYKARLLEDKKMWSIGKAKGSGFFGWEQAKASGAKRLIITEGEFDAVALHRIFEMHGKEEYKDSRPAVISVPHGAANALKNITEFMPEIRNFFKEISLAFDQDEAGKLAVEEICKQLPEITVITLPSKDANSCLIEGKGKAAYAACIFKAERPKNTRLVWGTEVHDKAKVPAEWGLSWPWPSMTEKTRGIRFGETIYLGAGEKMGKSEIVNAIGKHLCVDHNLKTLMAKPEESNIKTYKMLASKVEGKIFHDPKVKFDEEAYERSGKLIRDNLCMLNLYQNITWEALKNDMYAAASCGVKAVFIDPITNLTNGMGLSQINEVLQGVSQELATLAKDLDIIVFIFCHLNKPPPGSTPWDRGASITTNYFAGSSAMARSCNYALGLEGNKDPELSLEERNMRDLVLLADREFGESGRVKLYWDYKTGLFNEV